LKSVLFDLGKSDLRDASKKELDSLASLLNNDWPNVVIELRSHTDLRGSDTLNNRLSFDRALSCVNYLVEKGVDSQRLVPVGMADTEPVVLDNDELGLSAGVL
jgi:outer membrane protein OmpA-like peptidoglycan-associated protein